MAKEYLKGKYKVNTTTPREQNVVFGATASNPLSNAEISFDFIEAVAEQVSAEVTGDFVTLDDTQTITAAKTFSGDVTYSEVVTSPATSSTYAVKGKSVVHTCTAAATNTIAINIPVGAKILGASAIVSTALVFAGGGATGEITWTTSGQVVATALAAKNTKGSALFDENADSAIVSGSVQTMTLTPNAGTVDVGGVIVVTAWYAELTNLTNVA